MQLILLFLGIILFFVLALSITNYVQKKRGNTTTREVQPPTINLDGGCCGAHEICEKDSLIAAFVEQPEYFDDEELDKFVQRESDQYSAGEADEFRDVFYSVLEKSGR